MPPPIFFNLYLEEIIEEPLAKGTIIIKVNGRPINNNTFSDDTILIVEKQQDLHTLVSQSSGARQ